MPVSARKAALTALLQFEKKGVWPMETLDAILRREQTDRREAALASRITLTVMQNRSLLDVYIRKFCTTPLEKLDREVLSILRLSAAQILFMTKIPARAAVSEGVELCRTCGKKSAAGLVNAVLRRIAENKDTPPDIPGDAEEKLAVLYSHPLWMVRRFERELGTERCEAALRADNAEPDTHLMVNTRLCTAEELLTSLRGDGIDAAAHPWLPDCITATNAGDLTGTEAFQCGWFYVQDAAAKCAVLAAGIKPGMFVIDGCAAPGGKTVASAILSGDSGRVLSCDIQGKKLQKIEDSCRRLGLTNVTVRQADGRVPDEGLFDSADVVLADVPCSGLGVIRKKPEIRLKPEEEIRGLPGIQLAILQNLARYVKPGGVLVYSTCTVLPEENGDVVRAFLDSAPEFSTEDFDLPGPAEVKNGCVTFWQGEYGTDGFFVCRLRRKS